MTARRKGCLIAVVVALPIIFGTYIALGVWVIARNEEQKRLRMETLEAEHKEFLRWQDETDSVCEAAKRFVKGKAGSARPKDLGRIVWISGERYARRTPGGLWKQIWWESRSEWPAELLGPPDTVVVCSVVSHKHIGWWVPASKYHEYERSPPSLEKEQPAFSAPPWSLRLPLSLKKEQSPNTYPIYETTIVAHVVSWPDGKLTAIKKFTATPEIKGGTGRIINGPDHGTSEARKLMELWLGVRKNEVPPPKKRR